MDIGLFGGSFNPPHTGHVRLAREFREKGCLDMVWVLVAPDPPHKDVAGMVSYQHRLAMTQLAFAESFGVEVNRIEETLPSPAYTYRTVESVKLKHPGSRFWLCIGEDSLHDLPKWKHPELLIQNVELLVAKRGDYEASGSDLPEEWLKKVHYIDIEPMSISSSSIRNLVAHNLDIEDLVAEPVVEYIRKHRLYQI